MYAIAKLVMLFLWVFGIVLANGFWSTFFAIVIPLWGWYLSIEHLVIHFGLL